MKKRRHSFMLWTALALVAGLVPSLSAQPLHAFAVPLRSSGTLSFCLDACQFAAASGRTRLELPYAIALPPAAGGDSLTLNIDLELAGPAGILAGWHEQRHFHAPADSPLTFIDLKSCELTADTVAVRMSVRETGGSREGRIEARLSRRDFAAGLSLSDPLFISSMHRPEGSGDQPFLRGGLVMIPDPARLLGGSAAPARAFFYVEINHLEAAAAGQNSYTLHYSVSDLAGNRLLSEERPGLPVVQANTARVEKILLDQIPAGACRLDLAVTEQSTGATATASRYFTMRGGGAPTAQLPMTPADQERYLEQLRYFASREEIALFKKLDPDGKREFLLRFWQTKDPTPETPENEFMIDFFARLAEAQKRFNGGLKSDMARIYLRYGPPLQIERQASHVRYNKPVEIWNYGLNGSTQFVFVDRNNDGRWVLVHSNHPDEFSNTGWEKELQ
ncbi:MAG TPA: GWxTD domain-containing protein [bacterium]|nr:GWxTD domain-containing protein [bacterium]HPR88316.1 GWxTD domain-containing protein [bacterium]